MFKSIYINRTKLEKRLQRNDQGKNPLDRLCKTHDIAYAENKSDEARDLADKTMQKEAMKRVFAKDATFGERIAALGVSAAMKAKRSLSKTGKGLNKNHKKGKGCCMKKRKIALLSLIKGAKTAIKKQKPENINAAVRIALASVKKAKQGKKIAIPRIIKLPTVTGSALPLIAIFAGLSALGSIVGSANGIVKAINETKMATKQLDESKRHNSEMESIAIGNKTGKGFSVKKNKGGKGFYLAPFPTNNYMTFPKNF